MVGKSGMGDRDWRPFVYGGLASCVAEFGTFPIDTTKTRLQIQGQKIDANHAKLKYNGMVDCFLKIAKQEGFASLYSGIWPAVLRQATYGTIKFGTYYSLKSIIVEHNGGKDSVSISIVCAVVAGAVSSAIANPTDVIKVRMQVQGTTGTNIGLVDCFKDVYTHEGISGLWRGVNPTAQRAAVIAAVELPVYDFCKSRLVHYLGDNASNHFMSSLFASVGSAIASTPIDVVRTRLMNQRKLKKCGKLLPTHIYLGTADCFVRTFKNEGFWAFYKGFIPTLFRMGPWNIIFFITYEQLKKLY